MGGGQPKPIYLTSNITCHRCVQKGYLARVCFNQPAPLEEQQRVKQE